MADIKLNKWELRKTIYKGWLPLKVSATIELHRVEESSRKRLLLALERGYYPALSGYYYELYNALCLAYDLPGIGLRKERPSQWQRAHNPHAREEWFVRYWNSHLAHSNALLTKLFKGDQMAKRLDNETQCNWYSTGEPPRKKHPDGYLRLSILKDKKLFEEAVAQRHKNKAIQERVALAKKALMEGTPIKLVEKEQ